jgi:xanthine dehydrogenase YagT iron-sulfur-binding subunit
MPDDPAPQSSESDLDAMLTFGDPETRRKFLKKTAATGAAVALGPHLMNSALAQQPAPTLGPTKSETEEVAMTINGEKTAMRLDPRMTLLDALRERLGLTGTKKGCDHGQCGACTVLVNGRRINSCLSLAIMHDGDEVTTLEGLAKGDELHPVQAAFREHDGFQCGYCTPGQICSAVALIKEGHASSDDEIREWMSGNLCRCGAYVNIVAAIREAKSKTAAA